MSAPQPACPWCVIFGLEACCNKHGDYICTRPANHSGEHIWCTRTKFQHDLARWPNESEAAHEILSELERRGVVVRCIEKGARSIIDVPEAAPTAAAVRAAKAAVPVMDWEERNPDSKTVERRRLGREELARVIDRETELPELLADRERLDWIFDHGALVYKKPLQLTRRGGIVSENLKDVWVISYEDDNGNEIDQSPEMGKETPREAIDAARSALARAQGRDASV